LKNADIHDIVLSLAKYTNRNIAIPPDISGKISVFLDNVTFEDVL